MLGGYLGPSTNPLLVKSEVYLGPSRTAYLQVWMDGDIYTKALHQENVPYLGGYWG